MISREYVIKCDVADCARVHSNNALTKKQALHHAWGADWEHVQYKGTKYDLCPDHAKTKHRMDLLRFKRNVT